MSSTPTPRWHRLIVPALLLLLTAFAAWLLLPATPIAIPPASRAPDLNDRATIERGRYLAVLGNCMGCHTPRGQTPYAGGRGIATPWGTVFSSNLTPDVSGLKGWSAEDFWRALHHGQSRNGRWLNPVFPYTNTTHISRADSDALYVYFHSLKPVPSNVPPSELRWPYNSQAALKVWRTLYFRPGAEASAPAVDPLPDELRHGAYLVNGLAHCSACHMPRNALGGGSNMLDLSGGLMPVQNWYAPSLLDPAEAGVQERPLEDIVALLRSGRSGPHIVTGPMAEVVQYSTQHWEARDLQAMAAYLKSLPIERKSGSGAPQTVVDLSQTPGARLYEQHCAQCHGAQGQGIQGQDGSWAYPPLAGNPTVLQNPPANLLQSVLYGGFGPSTAAHPRPFGMPPYAMQLSEREVAQLLSYVRGAWGNNAAVVTDLEVQRLRGPVGRP